MRSHLAIRAFLVLIGSATAIGSAPAATFTVSADGQSHFPTLQSAINAAAPGDTVLAMPGIYTGAGNKELRFFGKDLVLRSRDGASATIIDCQYDGRAVFLQDGETLASRIEGLTIQHGDPDGPGGGMIVNHAAVTLKNVVFAGNRGSNNAGLDIAYSEAILDSVHFVRNIAAVRGGGIGMYLSTVVIRNSELVENEALWGGGIRCTTSTLTVEDVLIAGNTAYWDGGGMWIPNPSQVSVTRTEFRGNVTTMGDGGGLHVYNTTPAFQECLFIENLANTFGGGAYIVGDLADVSFQWTRFIGNRGSGPGAEGGALFLNEGAQCSVRNSTFAGNSTVDLDRGGTIEICWNSQLLMEDSIIAHTTDGYALCSIGWATATLTHCDLFGNLYGDIGCESAPAIVLNECLTLDPLLCDYAEGDVALGEGSPCLPENNPWGVVIGSDSTICTLTAVGAPAPQGVSLEANYPNPFNPSTTIPFALGEPATITLAIFDVSGRLIRTLATGRGFPAGHHELRWDGLDATSQPAPSGVYFYRLETPAGATARPMLLVK